MDNSGWIRQNNKSKKFHFDNIYMDNPLIYDSIMLYQIGDIGCEGGYSVGDHEQYCYELSHIVSGKGIYYSDGKAYPIKQGQLFLNRPGELHNYIADNIDPFRFFYVGFNFDEKITGQNSMLHIKKMLDQVEKPDITDRMGIQENFIKIFNEIIKFTTYSDMIIKMNLHQIIIYAYRNFFERWENSYYTSKSRDDVKRMVYEIVNYIDMNMYNITELTKLADDLGYSYSHLTHVFSKETGLTIKEYFNQKRFEKAVELLKDPSLSISRVAELLQYQSIHPFSTAFRKRFGVSPTEYQAIYHGHKNGDSKVDSSP